MALYLKLGGIKMDNNLLMYLLNEARNLKALLDDRKFVCHLMNSEHLYYEYVDRHIHVNNEIYHCVVTPENILIGFVKALDRSAYDIRGVHVGYLVDGVPPVAKKTETQSVVEKKKDPDKRLSDLMKKNAGFQYFMSNYSRWVECESEIAEAVHKWIEKDYSDESIINMVITEVRYIVKKIGEGSHSFASQDLYLDAEMLLEVFRRYNEAGNKNPKVLKRIVQAEKDWQEYINTCNCSIHDVSKLDRDSKKSLKNLWYFHEDVSTHDMGYSDEWIVN